MDRKVKRTLAKARTGHHCIVCGKRCNVGNNFPHGSFYLHSGDCTRVITQQINMAVPVVWTGIQDLLDREAISQEMADRLTPADERAFAQVVENYLWDGELMGDIYGDSVYAAGAYIEEQYIKNLPKKNLPLVDMSTLNTKEGKELLEKRLKGEA